MRADCLKEEKHNRITAELLGLPDAAAREIARKNVP